MVKILLLVDSTLGESKKVKGMMEWLWTDDACTAADERCLQMNAMRRKRSVDKRGSEVAPPL